MNFLENAVKANFAFHPSLLKTSFAHSSALGLGAEYAVSCSVLDSFSGSTRVADRAVTYFFNRLNPSPKVGE
jgi:hypothetical protein